jgi:hypothetical protein
MSLRASTFKRINGFNENLKMLEDNEIANRAKKHGKIVWDRSLRVFNDPRRFEQEGYLRRMFEFPRKAFDFYVLKKEKLDFNYKEAR